MNTSQAADVIGTTPRALRSFLRKDPTYRNAGSGGRYEFSDTDIPLLKKRFNAKQEKVEKAKPVVKIRERVNVDDEQSPDRVSVTTLRSRNRKTQAQIRAAAEARVDRLEAQLKAAGLHISQMGVAKPNRVNA